MKARMLKKQYKYLLVFYITIVCFFVFGVTFSKFISRTNGDTSVDVAKFSFILKKGDEVLEDNFSYNLASNITGGNNLSKSGIVPGKSGIINLTIDLTGTETASKYFVYLSPKQSIPANLKFYSDENFENELPVNANAIISGINNLSDVKIIDKNIYWKWIFDPTVVENEYENKELLFDIKVLVSQYVGGE